MNPILFLSVTLQSLSLSAVLPQDLLTLYPPSENIVFAFCDIRAPYLGDKYRLHIVPLVEKKIIDKIYKDSKNNFPILTFLAFY